MPPQSLDALGHRFIVYDEAFAKARLARWFARRLQAGAGVAVTNGVVAAPELCRAGVSIAVLPQYLAQGTDSLAEPTTTSETPTNELWLLSHGDLRTAARIRTTKAFVAVELETLFS